MSNYNYLYDFVNNRKNEKIVVVIGLGFVGSVMAGVISNAKNEKDEPLYKVIGIDLDDEKNKYKIESINQGKSPIKSKDPELSLLFQNSQKEYKNLYATSNYEMIKYADIVVLDINLDIYKFEYLSESEVKISPFKKAIADIGKYLQGDSLLLIETTVPPGTVSNIVEPIIINEFKNRGVTGKPQIAHSYERVMPGKNYVNSIKNYWRVYSANSKDAEDKANKFLKSIINTDDYPLTKLSSTNASELAKVLENTYRAMNIAFIYEWTLLAEKIGVNLFEVVNAIKMRKNTHNNIMKPGVGVGGYCLPKDPLFAQWAINNLFNLDIELSFSINAVYTNDNMPHHVFELANQKLKGSIKDKKVLLCGVSYLADVADTRNTPTKVVYNDFVNNGAVCYLHDHMVNECDEIPNGKFVESIDEVINEIDVIVFLVQHDEYRNINILDLINKCKNLELIVDGFDILDDDKIEQVLKNNIDVVGVGKGHIEKMKKELGI